MCSHFCSEVGYEERTHHQPQVLPLFGDFTAVPTFQLENTNRKFESCQYSGTRSRPRPRTLRYHRKSSPSARSRVMFSSVARSCSPILCKASGEAASAPAGPAPPYRQGPRGSGQGYPCPHGSGQGSPLPPWPHGFCAIPGSRGRALSQDGAPTLPARLGRREAASALSQDGGRQLPARGSGRCLWGGEEKRKTLFSTIHIN